jgi:predicted acyltransferase
MIASTERITSIDTLRGLTVAFMILVNDPGDWRHVYSPLDHAPWNGFTPTDMVFPMFIFLLGCSIVFSVDGRLKRGVPRRTIAWQVARRAATIFAIKMLLSGYPHFHMANVRIYGVLTRIALCYLGAGLLYLYLRSARWLAIVAVAMLLGYWMLLRFAPVPGLGHPLVDFPLLDPERNWVAYVDRGVSEWTLQWLHIGRLYHKTHDPEGLMSTIPAIATALFGVMSALWLRSTRRPGAVVVAGLLSLGLGVLWNPWFPINKNLWTSSYVLFAGGWSLLALGLAFWLLDGRRLQQRSRLVRAALWPALVFGSNALAAFIFSEFAVLTCTAIKLPGDAQGQVRTLWSWVYTHGFARGGSTENTSLAFALAFVAFCFIPNWLLQRRKLFLRV